VGVILGDAKEREKVDRLGIAGQRDKSDRSCLTRPVSIRRFQGIVRH
jgi:hypothetical protein